MDKRLTNPAIEPDGKVLKSELGDEYRLYLEFATQLEKLSLKLEWHYYNDYKSWLCKILDGKKNIGWLSVWDDGFRVTVYFNLRTISEVPKDMLVYLEPYGKTYMPLIVRVKTSTALKDAITCLEYKRRIK